MLVVIKNIKHKPTNSFKNLKENLESNILTFLGCFNLDWKGDGICDDQNNHAGCNFDGGDCCGPDADTDLCTLCQCLEKEAPLPHGKICRLLNYST